MDKVIIGAIIQARMNSSRLTGKSVRLLHRQPLITQVIERVQTCRTVDKVILATTYNKLDEVLLDRKSTRLNSSHIPLSRMPSSA